MVPIFSMPMATISMATQPAIEVTPVQKECLEVYHLWLKQEGSHPQRYLKQTVQDHVSLSDAIQSDFDNNNLITINGLLLSKSEAAFLAHIGASI